MILFNPYILFFFSNVAILFLYVLQLSGLYKPDYLFLLYYFSILLFFFVFSINYIYNYRPLNQDMSAYIKINNRRVFIVTITIIFILGVLTNIYQGLVYGYPIFLEDKIMRTEGEHYLMYLVNMLMIATMMSYIGVRSFHGFLKAYMIIILLISILSLAVWLNRGAFTLLFLCIVLYEYIRAKIKGKKKRFYINGGLLICGFILFFTYIGNLRTEYVLENIFKYTINDHYQMSNKWPTSFVWLYIYLTSPIENASLIFSGQFISEYKLGLHLFYPFVAPIYKLLFYGETEFIPPLKSNAGLTVGTFIPDALSDFGYVGPYIYMIALVILLRIGQKSLKKGIYGFICYVSALNIAFWMMFANAFAIGPFMIIYLFSLVFAWAKDVEI